MGGRVTTERLRGNGDGAIRAGEREHRAVSATSLEGPLRAEVRRLLER